MLPEEEEVDGLSFEELVDHAMTGDCRCLEHLIERLHPILRRLREKSALPQQVKNEALGAALVEIERADWWMSGYMSGVEDR